MGLVRVFKIVFFLFCVAGFLFGLLREMHFVYPLAGPGIEKVSGPGFAEIASYDGVMLKDGKLYDIYSIEGVKARKDQSGEIQLEGSGDATKTKDCKT